MNYGAFVCKPSIFTADEVAEVAKLSERLSETRRRVHATGPLSEYKWFEVGLDPELSFCRKVLDELEVDKPEVLGLYYLEPCAQIHPHRDLTGASHNDRIRFHVPIVTNSGVDFRVAGERVSMHPGDLWYLDTSYKHSVANFGTESRVHLIIECDISERIRRIIPGGFRARLHGVTYSIALGGKFLEALVKNSITNPAYFKAQMGMVARFVGWRFLKIRPPR